MTFTPNHWRNKEKSKQLLDNVIFPYLQKKKCQFGLPGDQKSLLFYDVFTGQTTANLNEYIEENDCVILYVPNNMTHYFQPLDLTVNAVAKHFFKDKFELWYVNEVKKQLDEGTEVYEIGIPLKLSILKPIHGRWFLGLYDHLRNNKEIIINCFESAVITEAVPKICPMKTRLPIWIRKMFFLYVKLTEPFCSYCFELETVIIYHVVLLNQIIAYTNQMYYLCFCVQPLTVLGHPNYPLKTALLPNLSHFFSPNFFPTL